MKVDVVTVEACVQDDVGDWVASGRSCHVLLLVVTVDVTMCNVMCKLVWMVVVMMCPCVSVNVCVYILHTCV